MTSAPTPVTRAASSSDRASRRNDRLRPTVGIHWVDSVTDPWFSTVVSWDNVQAKAAAGTSARARNASRPHRRTSRGAARASTKWAASRYGKRRLLRSGAVPDLIKTVLTRRFFAVV